MSSVASRVTHIRHNENTINNKINLIKPKIAKIIHYNHDDNTTFEWEDLKGKKVLNKNVFISGFPDTHPYTNPPVFNNAENVFLDCNYKYFTYYWLHPKIFPSEPTIYLNGHPCDTPVLTRKFNMYVIDRWYKTAKRYAGEANLYEEITKQDTLIKKISEEDYENLVSSFEVEDLEIDDIDEVSDNSSSKSKSMCKPLTHDDIERHNGVYSSAIMENAKW